MMISSLATYVLISVKKVHRHHQGQLVVALHHAIRLFLRAQDDFALSKAIRPDSPSLTLERAIKLLRLKLGLLPSVDGRLSRQGRFKDFLTGYIERILSWLLMCTYMLPRTPLLRRHGRRRTDTG